MKRLAIVVPCFNEEEMFEYTNNELKKFLEVLISKKKIQANSFILYVNDGSKDNTWNLIKQAYDDSKMVFALNLAGNKGHQNALYAGLMYAKNDADVTVSIDADLQDDVLAIEEMIDKYNDGCDIVCGVRNDRSSDSFFKRNTALLFYKIMNFLGAKSIYNHADFRLMSSRSLEELGQYSECHLYLRGIIPHLGFRQECVYYSRKKRLKGESKYPFKKMLAFAFNGISSFSVKPLTMILYLGIISIAISFIAVIYSVAQHFQGDTISGWTSTFISIWFLGGVQLASIGILGQYLGKTYIETKKRPRYFIESYLKHD